MTYEGILTFVGILLAAAAIARPVQRRSIGLVVGKNEILIAVVIATFLLVCRDLPLGFNPLGWRRELIPPLLDLGAFAVLLVPFGLWWRRWSNAKLDRDVALIADLVEAAIRENEFDEIDRVLRKNRQSVKDFPEHVLDLAFSGPVVSAIVRSRSMVHLEILAESEAWEGKGKLLTRVTDVVLRELLISEASPLRESVIAKYGGWEGAEYPEDHRCLIEKTLRRPKWYADTGAHYTLLWAAIEWFRRSETQLQYNRPDRNYTSNQGRTTRVRCQAYLAIKAQVIAIEAAVAARAEGDFFVTDLFDLFREVLFHSCYTEPDSDVQTPYVYLLREIASDLKNLADSASRSTATPEPILRDLVRTWWSCVYEVAYSQRRIPDDFGDKLIRSYLNFILELRARHTENADQDLAAHRLAELLRNEITERLPSAPALARVRKAMQGLDRYKEHVRDGKHWLEDVLE